MKKLVVSSLLALSAMSTTVMADGLNYTFVQAGYENFKFDDLDNFNPDGFSLKGSYLINENVFAVADYYRVTESRYNTSLELSQASFGIGYRYAANDTTDVFGVLAYENVRAEAGNESMTDTGYSAQVGVRSLVTSTVELNASFNFIDTGESDTFYQVGALYHLNDKLSAGVNYKNYDDAYAYGITMRYAF